MWDINWIAMVLAALAGFLVGGIWYGPLFQKSWQREAGITQEMMGKRNPAIDAGYWVVIYCVMGAIYGFMR